MSRYQDVNVSGLKPMNVLHPVILRGGNTVNDATSEPGSEETSMLHNVIGTVKTYVIARATIVGHMLKSVIEPARCAGALAKSAARDTARTRAGLIAENALLRQQLIILRRNVSRPRLTRTDRVFMILLARLNCAWRNALHLIEPETLLRWHRDIFKIIWRRKSRPRNPPTRLGNETIELIQIMAASNLKRPLGSRANPR